MKKITTIERAMNQFAYRLQNGRYEPNQNDVDAFKFVAEWINREKEKELKQQVLFAKLFCLVFAQEVKFYDGDFKFAQKKMHEYLKHPIEFYYDIFLKEINDVAMNKYIKSIGISEKLLLEESEKQKNENKIFEENWSEIERYFNGAFEEEKVYRSLNNTISEFINLYKNKE
jgi:hypothetical protein